MSLIRYHNTEQKLRELDSKYDSDNSVPAGMTLNRSDWWLYNSEGRRQRRWTYQAEASYRAKHLVFPGWEKELARIEELSFKLITRTRRCWTRLETLARAYGKKNAIILTGTYLDYSTKLREKVFYQANWLDRVGGRCDQTKQDRNPEAFSLNSSVGKPPEYYVGKTFEAQGFCDLQDYKHEVMKRMWLVNGYLGDVVHNVMDRVVQNIYGSRDYAYNTGQQPNAALFIKINGRQYRYYPFKDNVRSQEFPLELVDLYVFEEDDKGSRLAYGELKVLAP